MVNSFSIIIIPFIIKFIYSNHNISNTEINLLTKKDEKEKKLIYLSPNNNKLEVSGSVPFSITVSICDFNNLKELSFTYNDSNYRNTIPFSRKRNIEFKNWNLLERSSMNSISIHYINKNQLNENYGAEIIYSYNYIEKKRIDYFYKQLNLTIESNNNIINWVPLKIKSKVIYELYIIENNNTFLNNSCYLNNLKTKYKGANEEKYKNIDGENIQYYELKETKFTIKNSGKFYIQVVANFEENDILYRIKYNSIFCELYHQSYKWFFVTLSIVFFGLLFFMIILLNQKVVDNKYFVPLDKLLLNDNINPNIFENTISHDNK